MTIAEEHPLLSSLSDDDMGESGNAERIVLDRTVRPSRGYPGRILPDRTNVGTY